MNDMQQHEEIPMRLRHAILIYLGAIIAFFVLIKIDLWIQLGGWLIAISYLAIGVTLNRLVLKRLIEWHPMYNTISNIARAKLNTVIFWPISYAILFIQIAINKLL